jgi:hypothetical protein
MEQLRKLDLRGLRRRKVPTSVPKGDTETSNLAFCPLLVKYRDKGMCGRVDCRHCELPYLEYEERAIAWLCSVCAAKVPSLPYHGDGECEGCGYESSVLMLCDLSE